MSANDASEGVDLLECAVDWLRGHLPETWEVERSNRLGAGFGSSDAPGQDATVEIRAPNATFATIAVEARRSFAPRDVETLLPRLTRLIRTLAGNVPVLVVVPWLSQRAQELLKNEGINFIDMTGNALVRLENPAVHLQTTGAARNPQPVPRGRARVRGPKAGRLVRLLVDARPPYGVREIAAATGLNPGYVSRLLDALDREALVERSRRGQVVSVDVVGLLRRWAESYDVLKANDARSFLAPAGAKQALEQVSATRVADRVAVTGSFAAVRLAPVAAPALLLLYCDDPPPIIHALNLLPADEGGNVVLLRPFDRVVWERAAEDLGITYAAPSQVAADCLTGPGRMPAEGEAVLRWMEEDESRWRRPSLSHATRAHTAEPHGPDGPREP